MTGMVEVLRVEQHAHGAGAYQASGVQHPPTEETGHTPCPWEDPELSAPWDELGNAEGGREPYRFGFLNRLQLDDWWPVAGLRHLLSQGLQVSKYLVSEVDLIRGEYQVVFRLERATYTGKLNV